MAAKNEASSTILISLGSSGELTVLAANAPRERDEAGATKQQGRWFGYRRQRLRSDGRRRHLILAAVRVHRARECERGCHHREDEHR